MLISLKTIEDELFCVQEKDIQVVYKDDEDDVYNMETQDHIFKISERQYLKLLNSPFVEDWRI